LCCRKEMKTVERKTVQSVAKPAPWTEVADEAELMGKLEARLPANAFQRLIARLEDMTHPSERVTCLGRVVDVVDTYTRIVQEADRIILAGPRRAEFCSNGTVYRDISVNWPLLTHIALSAGWVRIGYGRLERKRAGRDATSPSPKDAPESGTHLPDSITTPVRGQVELIVAYEADGARFMPRIRGEELLEFRLDGQVVDPPAPTLDGVYRWLGTNGYVPDGEQFRWLDRCEGRRRRRQVYAYQASESIPERRLTHAQAWDATRGYRLSDL
jgi:hypothetical protein